MNSLEQRIKNFGAEKIFVALFLFVGVMILFTRPPYQLMDEINHFARTWQISEGIFLSPTTTIGDFIRGEHRSKKIFSFDDTAPPDTWRDNIYIAEVPASFLPEVFIADANHKHYVHAFKFDDVKNFLATPLNVQERELVMIPQTGVYPPPTYLPQAVVAIIGRALNLNAGIIFYAMGLSGLLFNAACVFAAMKLLPDAKPLIFLLAMMPMFLVEAASTSADAVTYGACIFATAWLLSLRQSTEKFSRAEIFGLIILAAVIAACKSVYGTILLLYFFIPRERVDNSAKKFWAFGIFLLAVNLSTALIWTELSVTAAGVEFYTSRYHGDLTADIAAQKIFVAEHPEAFFAAMINSLAHFKTWYAVSFIGTWSPQCDVTLPPIFYLLYGVTLIFFALSCAVPVKPIERAVMLFGTAMSVVAFFMMDYVIWSSVGGDMVYGIQGRYFIPLAPMVFVSMSFLPTMRRQNSIALFAGIFAGIMTLLTNFFAFY